MGIMLLLRGLFRNCDIDNKHVTLVKVQSRNYENEVR